MKEKKPTEKRHAGQPTKYKPEYCDMLIKHMSKGFSYESFAGVVDVDRDTLYAWEKVQPQFSDSKKKAFAKCMLFWENKGILGQDFGKDFNAAVWCFNMKNRFGWKDKFEADISTKDPSKMSKQEIIEELRKIAGEVE